MESFCSDLSGRLHINTAVRMSVDKLHDLLFSADTHFIRHLFSQRHFTGWYNTTLHTNTVIKTLYLLIHSRDIKIQINLKFLGWHIRALFFVFLGSLNPCLRDLCDSYFNLWNVNFDFSHCLEFFYIFFNHHNRTCINLLHIIKCKRASFSCWDNESYGPMLLCFLLDCYCCKSQIVLSVSH